MRYENEIVGKDAKKMTPKPEPKPVEPVENISVAKNVFYLVRDILVALAVIIIALQFVKPTIVFEHSMENTLKPEDYVFLSKQAYKLFGEIEFGDIVVCESTLVDDRGVPKNLIKRVIGLPGDELQIKDDAVYRNGERLVEPYTKDGLTDGVMATITVPPDSYFLLGDNREVSRDSRSPEIGFVSGDMIRGKVIFRLFPISSMGAVR